MKPKHSYTPEHKQFIKDNFKGLTRVQMTQLFNYHFSLDLKVTQITAFIKNHRLSNGLDGRFKSGQSSWNKGMKGLRTGGDAGFFKPGHKPHNYKPVGTERINSEGYHDIKVADPNVWQTKHTILWESVNGEVPDGYVLLFGDGDKSNITLDNLLLVSRAQLARLNQMNLIQDHKELTQIALGIADISNQLGKRSRTQSTSL